MIQRKHHTVIRLLKDHMDLASGAGALVNTNECHIQIAENGIYSMSDER